MEKEDLYAVMDLNNECSQGDIKLSYKNLVLKWHPDRFREEVEKDEANMKFQSIQRAYSVLSDSNKRLLYDVGAYDSDDDETGMADFINEMVTLMAQTQSTGDETVEEFEELFEELLKDDVNQFKTRSSSSPFTYGTSTSVDRDDLSNDDIANKINVDSYCCISSAEVVHGRVLGLAIEDLRSREHQSLNINIFCKTTKKKNRLYIFVQKVRN